jgi:hypothetical protein
MTEEIAGFMVVRNGVRNGYPFLEAIRSALGLCDRVHVAEGFSEDETYAVLARAAQIEPRLVLDRIPWQTRGGGGAPIRNALNALLARVDAEWVFQVDANDILPPESVPYLRGLGARYPSRELFALPYRQFLGRYWFNEEFRFRLARKKATIRVLWDGWTMGYRLRAADYLDPKELRRLFRRTRFAWLQDRVAVDLPEEWVHLERPIHHYYGLFPGPFLEKMRSKAWLQANPRYHELSAEAEAMQGLVALYESTGDDDAFFRGMLEHQQGLRAAGVPLNKEFPYRRFVPDEGHPAIVRPLLGQRDYRPDPGILAAPPG